MRPDKNNPSGAVQLRLDERLEQILQRGEARAAAAERIVPTLLVPQEETPKTWKVSELVQHVSQDLQEKFSQLWVEGEVSNVSLPRSGHCYFTLKDSEAQLDVVIFKSQLRLLKFRIETGQNLRCRGSLCLYEPRGRFHLKADFAEPMGLGALQLAFEQLRQRLQLEGLFEPQRKKALPFFPRLIAVVTSPTGAAVRDILRVLHSRCPVQVIVCPTAVQGSEAPDEICRALAHADTLGADLVIVGRGGGSLEDLWAFNDERVARAIFALGTPVISAVGHEIDVTIADLVADRRAPTPSAAAEMAVPVLTDVRHQMLVLWQRVFRAARQSVDRHALRLERLRGRLGSPANLVERERMRLDELGDRAEDALKARLREFEQEINQLTLRLGHQRPGARLARERNALHQLRHQLSTAMRHRVAKQHAQYGKYVAALDALSPLAVLARGYSVTQDQAGRIVRRSADVNVGDHIDVRLHEGQLGCRVEESK